MNNSPASIESIENDVSQFLAAMTAARSGIRLTYASTAPQESNPTSANSKTSPFNDTHHPGTSTTAAAGTANHTLESTGRLTERLRAELAAADQRAEYERMQKDWRSWAENVMSSIEKWLDRWDIGIANRVRLMGWADRLAWWGVKGSKKE